MTHSGIITGAVGIALGAEKAAEADGPDTNFPWESNFLYFTVREPFSSNTTGTSLVLGRSPLSNR